MSKQQNKTPKYPCGECNIGVRYSAILCTGPCHLWFHGGCVNISDKSMKKLKAEEINSWTCKNCTITHPIITNQDNSPNTLDTQLPDAQPIREEVYQDAGEGHITAPNNVKSIKTTHYKTPEETSSTSNDKGTVLDKIQSLENQDDTDLNLSLTLAAEAGNALLQENTKLKAENSQFFEKYNKLELELALTTERMEKMEQNEEKHLTTIENLHQEIKDLHNQLEKEKKCQVQLQKFYEEHDGKQRKLMDDYDEKIASLEKTIKSLKCKPDTAQKAHKTFNKDVCTQTTSPAALEDLQKNTKKLQKTEDIGTQTCSMEPATINDAHLPDEMEQIKLRLSSAENAIETMMKLQNQNKARILPSYATVQEDNFTYFQKIPPPPPPPSAAQNEDKDIKNLSRFTKKNHLSVSLQVSTYKTQQQSVPPRTLEHRRETTEVKQFCKFTVHRGPPITAKKLNNDESFEDFLQKHLDAVSINNQNMLSLTNIPATESQNNSFLAKSLNNQNIT